MRGVRMVARRRAITVVITTAMATLVSLLATAACGGADTPASVSGPESTATAARAATAVPDALLVSPAVLSSYRYEIALHIAGGALADTTAGAATATPTDLAGAGFTINIEGAVVNPDREHAQTKASLGFIELALERIQIGDRAWTRESGGEWKVATAGSSSPAIGGELDISPARIFAEGGSALVALNKELRGRDYVADDVNGLVARRYELNAEQFRAAFGGAQGLLPGDSQPLDTIGTLWVAEDSRVPIRIQLTSRDSTGEPAFEMDLTLTDLNDGITIDPPL
ncbi:MAG: hypothetical protein O3B31_03660 [Chloroflexi bacterium]|nr:hypothetical protein [Chloroflexota bacterium]MDA1002435.1 hypothetical protein [Chloroflexota bacterium]MQC27594.1 hypothetical protein [Chloroflexota bacterium]